MYNHFFKRIIDFVLSFMALTILVPVLLPIMLILLATGEHYVFYFQKRVGLKNRRFNIWKFATMLKNSPNMGNGTLTVQKDPRVLPVGRFLRKTKINELPQIINVLIGNMTLVGPRPLDDKGFEKYPPKIQASIYNVKPGITGIGSIIFRDEEKLITNAPGDKHEFYRAHIAPYKGELEMWYQKHLSFYTDFMLIFLTAWVIIRSKSQLIYKVFKDLPEKPEILK